MSILIRYDIGAARLTELLRSVAPRVLLVEEAGQVLEAHVLASLTPSIQHMILIGDPLQLRPSIENYQLSADNPGIGQVYQFDRSLMERLSSSELRMSRLDVQRRMRPEISELIRCTLYPFLIDNDVVMGRPSIRGMAKNVFFLDHRHAEGGAGEDSVSKTNAFEVDMIRDLVLHLLRQGTYTKTGDIVVLCAYLGQLVKLRKAFEGEVVTVVDERDIAKLLDHRDEEDVAGIVENAVQQVSIDSAVQLKTVDNFQGEEGRIVILSLARNSGGNPANRGIGFLKSKNRTNVALSRAREGMYILGNADDLAQSEMWRGVIVELKRQEAIGPAIPIACHRHPQKVTLISAPGQIARHAPTDSTADTFAHSNVTSMTRITDERIVGRSAFACALAVIPVINSAPYLAENVNSLSLCNLLADIPFKVNVGVSSVGVIRGTHVEKTFGASISVEEIVQRTMTVLKCFVKSVAAKLAVITPATAPAPSLCGEPCEAQTCPTCAPDNVKSQVVDFIMQSSLSDVDLDGDGLDSRLITLKCGHVFTVETLDGICELASYYKKQDERWLQLAPAPKGLQKHPLCPLCRVPITSKRYGRMLKRVDLDMAEQNVANKCRSTLRDVSEKVSAFNVEDRAVRQVERGLRDLQWDAFTMPDADPTSSTTVVDCEVIPKNEAHPVSSSRFGSRIKDRHQLPEALVTAWRNAAYSVLRAYDKACIVASTSSAHVRTWEAAVATLHHRYMAEPQRLEGVSKFSTVEEAALAKARKDCGAPSTPKADQRFRVEGCWMTIQIRFLLVQVAQGISEYLRKKGLDTLARTRWADFIAYILSSIRRDATLALEIAEKARSYRQVIKTAVLMMEAEYQTFSHRLGRQRNGMLLKEFQHEARAAYEAARAERTSQANRYRLFATQGHKDDEWLIENFIEPAQRVVGKWAKLIMQLKKGVVYTEVTDQEKRDVLKAFMSGFLGFNTRGHFYQCPNGHVYVITECGGAMEESRCPECGCAIGGQSHTLNRTNTRAMDYENLAREEGLGASPFAWGRDA
ncbi:hypothetical protein FRC01_007332 [Tulasnella sp. 417]|nr:hypothetical protein FRC01_007332 [Tulasnella sp. 417]